MANDPLPHDGWTSRKIIVGCGVLATLIGVASAALFTGIASFDQWASFAQIACPAIIVPLFGSLSADKFAQAKADKVTIVTSGTSQ